MFTSKRRKGMELAINTIMIMVVLLVLVVIVLMLVGRTGANLNDAGGDQMNITSKTTECQLLCYKCCRGVDQLDCGHPLFDVELSVCNCIDNKPTQYGC